MNITETANISCNTTITNNFLNITEDGSDLRYGESPVNMTKTYNTAGNYNITCKLNNNHQNYTAAEAQSWINVSPVYYCKGSDRYNSSGGNWLIDSNVVCSNEKINVTGNITVKKSGNLSLYNTTITFMTYADGSHFIKKNESGGLWIYDNDSNASTTEDYSWITANNTNFEYDFWVYGVGENDNFTMQNSKITDAGYSTKSLGIQLYNVSNVIVAGNNITEGARHGFYLRFSTNNNLTNNTISADRALAAGIFLDDSSNANTIEKNTITTEGNTSNGIRSSGSSNIIKNNTISTGGLLAISSTGIRFDSSSNSSIIANNTITTNGNESYGIFLLQTSVSNNISGNSITTYGNYSYGIYLRTSANSNTLSSNIITTNGSFGYGIWLSSSSNSNTLQSNTITTNGSSGYGIWLSSSSNSTIQNNAIITNGSSSYGILLSISSNNNVTNNNITATGADSDGVYIDGTSTTSSDNNIIQNNNITNSGRHGINIVDYAENNIIYDNNNI